MTGVKQWYLYVFGVVGVLALAAWLVFGLDRTAPRVPDSGNLESNLVGSNTGHSHGEKPGLRRNDGSADNGDVPTPPEDGDPRDLRLPDPAVPTAWDPANIRSKLIIHPLA